MPKWFLFKIGSINEAKSEWFVTAEIKKSPSLDKLNDVTTIQFELGDESLPVPNSEFVEVNLANHLIDIEGNVLHTSEWREA